MTGDAAMTHTWLTIGKPAALAKASIFRLFKLFFAYRLTPYITTEVAFRHQVNMRRQIGQEGR